MKRNSTAPPSARPARRPTATAGQNGQWDPTMSETDSTPATAPRSPWAKLMMLFARYVSTSPTAMSAESAPSTAPWKRIAFGAGTDVAVESAGIVLVRSDPRDVVSAIELSRATYSKMTQNLAWATGYNLVAIPVAMGVFVPWGIDLPMAVGAIAMSASTIIVAANAQLLRRLRLNRQSTPPPASPRLATA